MMILQVAEENPRRKRDCLNNPDLPDETAGYILHENGWKIAGCFVVEYKCFRNV